MAFSAVHEVPGRKKVLAKGHDGMVFSPQTVQGSMELEKAIKVFYRKRNQYTFLANTYLYKIGKTLFPKNFISVISRNIVSLKIRPSQRELISKPLISFQQVSRFEKFDETYLNFVNKFYNSPLGNAREIYSRHEHFLRVNSDAVKSKIKEIEDAGLPINDHPWNIAFRPGDQNPVLIELIDNEPLNIGALQKFLRENGNVYSPETIKKVELYMDRYTKLILKNRRT